MWHDVLESIKVSVSSANYTTWFKQTHLSSLKKDNNRFTAEIGCASAFIKNTIESRYFGLVQENLYKTLNQNCDVTFIVKENPAKDSVLPVFKTPLFESALPDNIFEGIIKAGIRPGFTFKNFAVSSSNQMAWAAAEAVSKELGKAYNPLFIWGG